MAKTAASVSAVQILGALAACAGVVFVISRSVRTDPTGSTSAAAPLSEKASPQPERDQEASVRQELPTATTVEPEPTATVRAVPSQERLASQLDSLAETFLTEQPDILGLMGALRTMVRDAAVLPETVKLNEEDGAMQGEILVSGLGGKATFKITGKKYRIEFEPAKRPEPPFFMRNVTLGFRDDGGRADSANINVQYHPQSGQAFKSLSEDEERVVGWNLDLKPEGIHANPTTMRRAPVGEPNENALIIGHPLKVAPRDENGASDLATFDAWLRLLQPYAK